MLPPGCLVSGLAAAQADPVLPDDTAVGSALVVKAEGHALGVPLNGDNGQGLVSEALDDPIIAHGGEDEIRRDFRRRLMVGGVDDEFPAVDPVDDRAGLGKDGMVLFLGVPNPGVTGSGGQVLDELPAEGHGQHLMAPADAEDGLPLLHKPFQYVELQIVQLLIDVFGAVDLLAVIAGMDVGAAGEHQPVELVHVKIHPDLPERDAHGVQRFGIIGLQLAEFWDRDQHSIVSL